MSSSVMQESPAAWAAPGLAGKVAVVTGASGAIGGAIARALARCGASVAVTGRNADALENVARDIRQAGGRVAAITADLTREEDVTRLRDEAERALGPASLLAAAAGGTGGQPVPWAQLSLERWREAVDGNLTSTFLTLKAFLPGMAARGGGAVVTVASLAGQHTTPSLPGRPAQRASPAYAAAKAGLLMLTRHAAAEFGVQQVRINALCPGAVLNAWSASLPPQVKEQIAGLHPLGRMGTPEDAASAALYLLSEASSWVTGITLDLNGGMHMA